MIKGHLFPLPIFAPTPHHILTGNLQPLHREKVANHASLEPNSSRCWMLITRCIVPCISANPPSATPWHSIQPRGNEVAPRRRGAFMETRGPDAHNWILEQCVAHDSPIIHLLMRPFRKPWVIITDFQEANDILTRPTRESDRSPFFGVRWLLRFTRSHVLTLATDCEHRMYSSPCSRSFRSTCRLVTSGKCTVA